MVDSTKSFPPKFLETAGLPWQIPNGWISSTHRTVHATVAIGDVLNLDFLSPYDEFGCVPLSKSDHENYETSLGSGIPVKLKKCHCYWEGATPKTLVWKCLLEKNTWPQIVPEINLAPEKCKIKIGWNILSMDMFELFMVIFLSCLVQRWSTIVIDYCDLQWCFRYSPEGFPSLPLKNDGTRGLLPSGSGPRAELLNFQGVEIKSHRPKI